MKTNQHISVKTINGKDIFRIHDAIDGHVANVRAVEKVNDAFTVMLDLTDDEAAFIHSPEDIHLYMGSDTPKVEEAIRVHEQAVEANMKEMMRRTAYTCEDTLDVRTIAGHTYVISDDTRDSFVPRVDYAFGASDGKIIHYGPVPEAINIASLVLDIIEHPHGENTLYQIGPSEYLSLTTVKNTIVSIPLLLSQEESGQLAWSSDNQYFRYFIKQDGHATMIEKPDTLFKDTAEAQAYLEEVAKVATDRVLKKTSE